jgi:hypothetical protein
MRAKVLGGLMISFNTDNYLLKQKFDMALTQLSANLRNVYGVDYPVLVEGGIYTGIWLECGPLEGLVYAAVDTQVAEANHNVFMDLQREDGFIPCYVLGDQIGTSQIQIVVPFSSTAYQLYMITRDQHFLKRAYKTASAYDNWLATHRDSRGLGLCEAFCEYDTGHDNSPRWNNIPKMCPDSDAGKCPDIDTLPYLAPDLSATLYGSRIALAEMAVELGLEGEQNVWLDRAEKTRKAIMHYCFDEQDLCFYDLNRYGEYVKIKGDLLTRVMCEHVVDQATFDLIYNRHIINRESFWTPYPLPSIAIDDPQFVKSLPNNSWGGASQALTALRAPRWFEYYGKNADLAVMMKKWLYALCQSDAFMQQMNPWTGEFSTSEGYSPAMCVMIDYTARLYGVLRNGNKLCWNCSLPDDSTYANFAYSDGYGVSANLNNSNTGSIAYLNNKEIFRVSDKCRVVTDLDGKIESIIHTLDGLQDIT